MKNLFFLVIIIITSCNNSTQQTQEASEDIIKNTDSVINNISTKGNNVNKTINLDTNYYLSAIKLAKDTIDDYDKFKLKDFTYLKLGQTQFKYYIISELNFYNTFKSFLIAADYESEQSCWIVNYSEDYNILSSYEVYHDNAEGAWLTTTSIDEQNKLIKIKTDDIYRDPEEIIYSLRIDKNGQFSKL